MSEVYFNDLGVPLLRTPWSDLEVQRLWRRQSDRSRHPYTCSAHGEISLEPSHDGWRCPVATCNYRQNWAHADDVT